jgi:succinate dehydrogenase / fumarate reductase iron-sulfur subunit
MNSEAEKNLNAELYIFRGTSCPDSKFETFNVPFQQGASVLDALIWINDNVDETLSFRYSCINANACKECMMLIDGEVEYACLKKLQEKKSKLQPLPNKKLIKDLVTDIVPPKEKFSI